MSAITLTALTCNSTYNPNRDIIALRINNLKVATFDFTASGTNHLSFSADSNDLIELRVRNNLTGEVVGMGKKTAAVHPSAISYLLDDGNYALSYV